MPKIVVEQSYSRSMTHNLSSRNSSRISYFLMQHLIFNLNLPEHIQRKNKLQL